MYFKLSLFFIDHPTIYYGKVVIKNYKNDKNKLQEMSGTKRSLKCNGHLTFSDPATNFAVHRYFNGFFSSFIPIRSSCAMETSSSLFNFFENLSSSDIEPDISNEETTDFSFHGDRKTIISSENIERCETDLSRTVPQFPNEFSDNNSCSVEEDIEVVMAVYWKRGKLGAAYYTCSDSQVRNIVLVGYV